jgi:putative ATPase
MSELFPFADESNSEGYLPPLADRIRPKSIDEVAGQQHLIGKDGPLRQFFESGNFPSMIFWGPPGVGKTTFAMIISEQANYYFVRISAVESGVKEVRQIISNAEKFLKSGKKTLLFIDEIHRFNKSQQDALLHAVEKGIITLIGATTENPSFEVNSALLSRCQVYRLQVLSDDDIRFVIENALKDDIVLNKMNIEIEAWDFLLKISGGDARTALNAIDIALKIAPKSPDNKIILTRKIFEKALQQKTANYDKKGEQHYDTISAFIKTLRGSDPDAAMFWLAKMLDAGEEPRFIARRMVVFASEDIGNADVYALTLAISVFQAVEMIGLPECAINLAQGVTYLASCPKSNASYMALMKAKAEIEGGASQTVPLHLRNAPTQLMKDEGYHLGYKYPHDFDGHFVKENYFPPDYVPRAFYLPGNFGREEYFKKRLESLWPERYKKEEK